MNRGVVLVVMVLLMAASASAQKVFLGPALTFKGGLNVGNIPDGQKTAFDIHVMPDITANVLWLFNKGASLGLLGDVGYATYSFRMMPENENLATDDATIIIQTSYFIVAPGFFFSGFTVGVAIGFPAALNSKSVSGSLSVDGSTDDLNTLIELRGGGMIPLWDTQTGRLSLIVHFGYGLTGLLKMEKSVQNSTPRFCRAASAWPTTSTSPTCLNDA
jgi:hypothetical protein